MHTSLPTSEKAQIASILATSEPVISLDFMDVQMQSGSYDCGLFAIAFATALVFNEQPGRFLFDQHLMRAHLLECFKHRRMTQFPVKKLRRTGLKVKTIEEMPVYCICRMPELPDSKWIECTSCKGWYHSDTCVLTLSPEIFFRKTKWLCCNCM